MIKRLFFKLCLALLPILAMLVFYICTDPFMVVHDYPDLYTTAHPHLELNEDYVCTETFLRLPNRDVFDSYVFGSSRSRYFAPREWALRSPGINVNHVYQFCVASETLFGIAGKIEMLDRNGIAINNVLIIADADLLSRAKNSSGHLFRKHPEVSGESKADFQFTSFKDFISPLAISSYMKLPPQSPEGVKDPNQLAEINMQKNIDSFYASRMHIFYKRPTTQQYEKQVIFEEQKQLLQNMKNIFDIHHTNYRIIISPLYDQKKLNSNDIRLLYSIFGKDKVYDFSGINDITRNIYNYFETSHYRPAIANRIMDSIYAHH